MAAVQHRATIAAVSAGPVRVRMAPSPTGFSPHRRRSNLPLQLAVRARSRRRLPAANREHGHEPRGGSSPSRRSSARFPGSASTGTDRRPSSSTAWSAPRQRRGGSWRGNGLRGRGRDPDPDARRGRDWAGTTRSRAGSSSRTRSSRTSFSSARTADRPTTSPPRSRTGSTESRTSIRGDDHVSNTPKQIVVLTSARGRARRSMRTSRTSSAPTGRSSRSATGPSRSTSSAPPGTWRRRS